MLYLRFQVGCPDAETAEALIEGFFNRDISFAGSEEQYIFTAECSPDKGKRNVKKRKNLIVNFNYNLPIYTCTDDFSICYELTPLIKEEEQRFNRTLRTVMQEKKLRLSGEYWYTLMSYGVSFA